MYEGYDTETRAINMTGDKVSGHCYIVRCDDEVQERAFQFLSIYLYVHVMYLEIKKFGNKNYRKDILGRIITAAATNKLT